jgi:hypothetical protein
MPHLPATDRRTFLGHSALAAAALAAPAALLAAAPAAPAAPALPNGTAAADDRWLDRLRGRHRQIFDMPRPTAGVPMYHVRNYLDTYRTAYGLAHPDVDAVVGLYAMTVPLALTDAAWAKYGLGAATAVVDAETGKPAERNVFWKPRPGAEHLPVGGGPLPIPNDTAITELQQRGASYIVCNNALNFWAGVLARGAGAQPAAVRAELDAHLIPGVVVVPAMVIAFQRAQARGASYMFLP